MVTTSQSGRYSLMWFVSRMTPRIRHCAPLSCGWLTRNRGYLRSCRRSNFVSFDPCIEIVNVYQIWAATQYSLYVGDLPFHNQPPNSLVGHREVTSSIVNLQKTRRNLGGAAHFADSSRSEHGNLLQNLLRQSDCGRRFQNDLCNDSPDSAMMS